MLILPYFYLLTYITPEDKEKLLLPIGVILCKIDYIFERRSFCKIDYIFCSLRADEDCNLVELVTAVQRVENVAFVCEKPRYLGVLSAQSSDMVPRWGGW